VSRADDGARPVLLGGAEEDAGVTSHGVTRASKLRPGQQIMHYHGRWHTIATVSTDDDGDVSVITDEGLALGFPGFLIVKVRDILHDYTEPKLF